jgi:hypothetical protein
VTLNYVPVFVGKSNDEKIVLYKSVDNDTELHIKVGDDVLRALSPDAEIRTEVDLDRSIYYLWLTSPEWTGEATGNRHDLIEEEAL